MMLPGVIVDGPRHTVFVMRDTNELEAVDVASGKTRWKTKQAEKPLWLSGTQLLAQSATSLVILDARTGKLVRTCTPAASTTWSPPSISGKLGWRASVSAKDGGADRAAVEWTIDTHYAGGAEPTEEVERRSRTHQEGVVDVDMNGCTFASRAGAAVSPVSSQAPPVTEIQRGNSITYSQVAAARVVDGTEVRVVLEMTDGTALALLRRGAGATALPDIELASGTPLYVHPWLSSDGRHAVVAVQDKTSGAGGVFHYDHALHDALTGQRVAAFRVTWHAGGVIVAGPSLLEVTSSALRGFDHKAGKERWKRLVRSTVYNGPMPP
jgi:hypothetical protein